MNPTAAVLMVVAAVLAVGSWISVTAGVRRLEYVCKPATMAALAAMALVLVPRSNGERALFVVALLLGLAGDVFLMLPRDYLMPGLVAFLLGHIAYIAGFRFLPFDALPAAGALALVIAGAAAIVGRYVSGLRRSGQQRLVV